MTFEYTTRFSPKRKTLGLVVERDKSVVVMAPEGTQQEKIEDFVERRRMWLYEKINHTPKFDTAQDEVPFVSGKSIMYLGKNYKLDVRSEPIKGIKFRSKFMLAKENQPKAKDLLVEWYRSKAKEKLSPKIDRYARQMGVEYNKLFFSDLKYRWGSCSPSFNLNFNYKLIKAPHFVIDYIIIHELAHLIELNHTPEFWNIVRIQMPNYEEARDWLKVNGGRVLG